MTQRARVPIVQVTRDGIVQKWNAAAETLFGYSAAEMVGKPVAILGTCDDRRQKVNAMRRVRAGSAVRNLATVRIAKDGRRIRVALTITPIKDRAGAVVGMSTTVIDMSARNVQRTV